MPQQSDDLLFLEHFIIALARLATVQRQVGDGSLRKMPDSTQRMASIPRLLRELRGGASRAYDLVYEGETKLNEAGINVTALRQELDLLLRVTPPDASTDPPIARRVYIIGVYDIRYAFASRVAELEDLALEQA